VVFLGFVLMIPLAVTSTRGMIRRLGKRWTAIHRLIYVSAMAGVIHYYWLVKADHRLPLTYAAILAVLLAYRIGKWARPKTASGASCRCASKCIIARRPWIRPAKITSVRPRNNPCHDTLTSKLDSKLRVIHGQLCTCKQSD